MEIQTYATLLFTYVGLEATNLERQSEQYIYSLFLVLYKDIFGLMRDKTLVCGATNLLPRPEG